MNLLIISSINWLACNMSEISEKCPFPKAKVMSSIYSFANQQLICSLVSLSTKKNSKLSQLRRNLGIFAWNNL